MNTQKKLIFTLLTVVSTLSYAKDAKVNDHADAHHTDEHHRKHGIFNQTIINFIDGKSYGFDGATCALTLKARSEILTILDGKLVADKTRQGLYTFEGRQYCVRELADLEAERTARGIANTAEFKAVLELAKKDFVEKMHKFMEPARGMKKHMISMIEDFCNHYKMEDSLLLKWGEAPTEAAEHAMFAAHITNFAALRDFCSQLTLFLKELVASCPKGKEQFKQMLNEIQSHKQ